LNDRDKSQEQTTSKKAPTSVSRIGSGSSNPVQTQNTSQAKETVVTPAKNSMPRNQAKGISIIKNSNDKT